MNRKQGLPLVYHEFVVIAALGHKAVQIAPILAKALKKVIEIVGRIVFVFLLAKAFQKEGYETLRSRAPNVIFPVTA